MKQDELLKLLTDQGVLFDHHRSKHDIFIQQKTGKKIAIPQHTEFSNKFIKKLLKILSMDNIRIEKMIAKV